MGLDNPVHIALIALVLLLLFGAKRLPEIGKSLGGGIREFKGSLTGENDKAEAEKPTVTPAATSDTPEPQKPAA